MNYKEKLKKFFYHKTGFEHSHFAGRTNTHIWLLAEYLSKKYNKPTIIVPTTSCVSPILIFKFFKIKMIFVDIDINTGLLKDKEILKIIRAQRVNAIFYINLYGNLSDNLFLKTAQERKILIIQDLAQTFIRSSKIKNKKYIFGDILLLSFGYSKIFDLGEGGVMLTNNINIFNQISKNYEIFKEVKNNKINYKKKYLNWYKNVFVNFRRIKIDEISLFIKALYLKKIKKFLYKKMYIQIQGLEFEERRRLNLLKNYKNYFKNKKIKIIHSKDVLIPWRFSFTVNKKNKILNKLRSNNYDASSYYLSFKKVSKCNSYNLEKKIINLWLTDNIKLKDVQNQYNLIKDLV